VLSALVAGVLSVAVAGGGSGSAAGEPVVTIAAVGDVQLGRGVGRAIERSGVDYPLARVRGLIEGADLAILNLECALSQDGVPIAKRFSFRADPAAADGLARAGFDVAVLANNHSMDCGRWALAETLEALRARGIAPVGAGMDAGEAAAPLIVDRGGLRIAILARTFILPDGVIYREDAPTIAVWDPARIEDEVRAARQQAEVVVVSLHWGVEYARQPQESQRRLARRLIEAGATLVIGHHTHTPQPVERHGAGLIAYSLGDFVFDSRAEGGGRGVVLLCQVGRSGVIGYEVIPVVIEDCQPRRAGEGAAHSLLRTAGARHQARRAATQAAAAPMATARRGPSHWPRAPTCRSPTAARPAKRRVRKLMMRPRSSSGGAFCSIVLAAALKSMRPTPARNRARSATP